MNTKMGKIFIAILTVIAMLAAMNSIVFAGGEGATEEMFEITDTAGRHEQKTSVDGRGQGWIYESATRTLTLDGINGFIYAYHMGFSDLPFTIVLKDGSVNTLTGALLQSSDYIIKGNGTLIIDCSEKDYPAYVTWSGDTTVESGTIIGKNCYLSAQRTLTINGGDVSFDNGIEGYSVIFNGGKLSTSVTDAERAMTSSCFETSSNTVNIDASKAYGKSGEELKWERVDGFLKLLNPDGTLASYAVLEPADCFASDGTLISSWAKEAVNKAKELGLLHESLGAYNYELEDTNTEGYLMNISRGEFASIVVNMYEKISGSEIQLTKTNPFEDVDIAMNYGNEILKGYEIGLINGTSDTAFSPRSSLTREQASTILYRAYTMLHGAAEPATETFADDSSISAWAKEAVYAMAGKGILLGMGEGNFAPQNPTQIQQAIVIAVRMLECF